MTSIGQFTSLSLLKCAEGCSDIKKDMAFLHTQVHHIVVGTLDRLDFILKRGLIKTDFLKLFAVYQADEIDNLRGTQPLKQV